MVWSSPTDTMVKLSYTIILCLYSSSHIVLFSMTQQTLPTSSFILTASLVSLVFGSHFLMLAQWWPMGRQKCS